ncbi:MAG: hypothetical protein IPG48_01935 [Saprospiraceae bacterium]|nr:hypothetical protein [Saprospiraceae bacterium]
MSNQKKHYFTAPIVLLQGFMTDHKKCLVNIGSYAYFIKHKELREQSEDSEEATKKTNAYFGGMFTDTQFAFKTGLGIHVQVKKLSLPFTSISSEMAKDFIHADKPEIMKVTLLAFLALKSISGSNDGAVKSNKQLLFSRMAGLSKPLANPLEGNFEAYQDEFLATIPESLHKWYHRRGFEKIKNQLQVFWGVSYYSYRIRGFYFSFKMPLEHLIKFAESQRIGLKVKSIHEQTKAARQKAISELYPHLKKRTAKGT